MTNAQKALAKKHGTPSEFIRAVYAANAQGLCNIEEADAGIAKYEKEWKEAGKRERWTFLKRRGPEKTSNDPLLWGRS